MIFLIFPAVVAAALLSLFLWAGFYLLKGFFSALLVDETPGYVPPPLPVTPPVDSAAIFARLRGDLADPNLGRPQVEPHPGQRWTADRRRDARDEQAQWQDLFDILSR
jgi:hypothetical protein